MNTTKIKAQLTTLIKNSNMDLSGYRTPEYSVKKVRGLNNWNVYLRVGSNDLAMEIVTLEDGTFYYECKINGLARLRGIKRSNEDLLDGIAYAVDNIIFY